MCVSTTRCARAGLWTTRRRLRRPVGAPAQPCPHGHLHHSPVPARFRPQLRRGAAGAPRRRSTPVCRGAYLTGPPPEFADARHLLLLRAAREHLVSEAVVSHVSAALVHGIDLWRSPMDRMHVTRRRAYGGRRGERVHVHVAPLDTDKTTFVDGVLVTSPARTVVDIARTLPFEQAVVAADFALRHGLVDRDQLPDAAARAKGWPGAPAARRVVAFADGRSESVGESRSRVRLAAARLVPDELQWQVIGPSGLIVATTDFAWLAHRTVAEFDGEIKYGRLLRPGETPGDAVFREKRRESKIRDEALTVVRWTWQDLDEFNGVAARIRQALRSRTR